VVKIATFAKPQNVISNPMETVQPSTDGQEMNGSSSSDKPFWLSLRKIKREATQPHENQPFVASHFILPKRANTAPMKLNIFNIATLKKYIL
jgi:hypothetical protein